MSDPEPYFVMCDPQEVDCPYFRRGGKGKPVMEIRRRRFFGWMLNDRAHAEQLDAIAASMRARLQTLGNLAGGALALVLISFGFAEGIRLFNQFLDTGVLP